MIIDWIGRREAQLPINQNYDKIRETNKPSIELDMWENTEYMCDQVNEGKL